MDNIDVFAAMGISGFGKTVQKTALDPARFDKNKREEVRGIRNSLTLESDPRGISRDLQAQRNQ